MPTATLTFGLSTVPIALSSLITYSGEGGAGRVEFTGAGSHALDLAMMPAAGCKGVLIAVEPKDAAGAPITAPISIHWTSNGIAKVDELTAAPGSWGVWMISSPSPVNGITALSIAVTAPAVVHAYLLG